MTRAGASRPKRHRGRMSTETSTFQYFPDTAADGALAGQLKSITDPLGHAAQFAAVAGFASYTPSGDPQSVVDPNGVATEYAYDARGRMVSGTLLPATPDYSDPDAPTFLLWPQPGGPGRIPTPARIPVRPPIWIRVWVLP